MATSKATKILVADSMSKARRIAETFGLSREEWRLSSFGDTQTGRRFEQAIVFWPVDCPPHWVEWYEKVLRTKLPPGVKPIVF